MRFLYSVLLVLSTPVVLLYFSLRGFRDRAYFSRWGERFGYIQSPGNANGILIHVASVGEFNAASPLIKTLLASKPDFPITITTLTPTGSERAKREFGDKVLHSYIPIDLPGAVSRFLDRLQPGLIIVVETEIWPNLYLQAQQQNIPLLMVNARLSERSSQRFQYFTGFVQQVLKTVTWIGAQTTEDTQRLINNGARPEHTCTTGNLKFDLDVPPSLKETGVAMRSRLNPLRPVLVAGSTHEADENVVIPAFVELLTTLPDALLILVPRHPERFARAIQSAKDAGLATELRSHGEVCSQKAQCFVIDAMGELMTYYACADVAFVGGSMGEQGGHNPLEPAALGKPVLLGPNMENAKEIAAQMLECNAAMCVTNHQELRIAAEQILNDGAMRDRMGQAGRALVKSNTGALDLTLAAINKLL